MAFCTNCGSKLDDNSAFCTVCGTAVKNDVVNQPQQSQVVYEEFVPTLGMGRKFAFKEKSLIYSDKEYEYAKLKPITLITAPTFASNGVAQTTSEDGELLTLAFSRKDNARFNSVLSYANEQINAEHGNAKKYKFVLQSPSGSKVEVYSDYLIVYYIKGETTKGSESVNKISKCFGLNGNGLTGKITGGLGKAIDSIGSLGTGINNTFKCGATGDIIMFADLNVNISGDNLIINEYSIPIGQQNFNLAKEIIDYIDNTLKSANEKAEIPPITSEVWEPIVGKIKEFNFYGKSLRIPENLDVFNSYRSKFKEIAQKCLERARSEYDLKINDFISFMEFFPKIYADNLSPIIQKAVDVLVANGNWTVTFDSFYEQHTSEFHLGIDDYNAMTESVNLTVANNQRSVAGVMSHVPTMVGGGFGFKGALKGVAMATTFNAVTQGISNAAIKNARNITPPQQAELYGRIKADILLKRVFLDYWNVYISLVCTLKNSGSDIWWQTRDADQQYKNIFQNLSNPNFPQDKVLDTLIELIVTNPYSPEYYEFAISRFGQSEDITKIKEYFGLTE